MVNHGISVESAPVSNKQKEQPAVVKQNGRFAGIAKKKNRDRQTNSLVDPPTEPSASDNEPQEQAYSMIMIKPTSKKNYSPRTMNKMLVGYTRHYHKDAACNREHAAAKERVLSSESATKSKHECRSTGVYKKIYLATTKPKTCCKSEMQ
jgi:hypothetical protein